MARFISNTDELATTDLRRAALSIAEAGLSAINVGQALERAVRAQDGFLYVKDDIYPLEGKRLHVVSIGKCALSAAAALERILGKTLSGGIAFDIREAEGTLSSVRVLRGAHPKPSEDNVEGSKTLALYLEALDENDIVIALISGGGSALLSLPPEGANFADETRIFDELTAAGANITELNTVRKHTSLARGGGLAKSAYPASIAALIVSDVPGNDIATIASGPFVKDVSTVEDAKRVMEKYTIPLENLSLVETPKDDMYFERVRSSLLITSEAALEAMWRTAQEHGFAAEIEKTPVSGEAGEVGEMLAKKLSAGAPKTAFILSGETTVTLGARHGEGGRNQELSLSALPLLPENGLVLSLASDGRDNTSAAGGIADRETLAHAKERGLSPEEYRHEHRSFEFFKSTGDAVITGSIGSNVSDLLIALRG